jgi:DNA primase
MKGRVIRMLSVTQRRSLERATLQYMNHLDEALDYLGTRGIAEEVARSVGLGVVRNPIPGHEHLEGRLAIPYLTDFGPVNMNFRCLASHKCKDEGHQKYMTWTGLETNLYSVQSLQEAGEWIAVAEGELDALSLNIAGVPAVGIAGATKWSEHWNNVFEDFTRVYVFQDGDEAGKKFGDTLVREVGALRVALAAGDDVNSTLVKHGSEYLRSRIRT